MMKKIALVLALVLLILSACGSEKGSIEGYWMAENGETVSFTANGEAIIEGVAHKYSVYGDNNLSISLLGIAQEFRFELEGDELLLKKLSNGAECKYYRSEKRQAQIQAALAAQCQDGTASAPESGVERAESTQSANLYVYDDADVLSDKTEEWLSRCNSELYKAKDAVVAVVTTNYGDDDLFDFALDYADYIGLGGNDFIVVLDIQGENYWLVQGSNLINQFTDEDCGIYAWKYMENSFAVGDYDTAVRNLVEALETWYYEN